MSSVDRSGAALGRVPVSIEELLAVGGSLLGAGRPYLVGSLAQGFGNHGSDIDIHLFVAGLECKTPSFLYFVNGVPVDVEHFPASEPEELIGLLDSRVAGTPAGPIALTSKLDRRSRSCLTRWLTALPLQPDLPSLLDSDQASAIPPHLLRHALKRVLMFGAVAETVDRSGLPSQYAWRLCARALLDLMCTARGWPTIGAKWLPARVRRAHLSPDRLAEAEGVHDESGLVAMLDRLGLPAVEPTSLAFLRNDPGAHEFRIGRQRFVRTRYGRLRDCILIKEGFWSEVVPVVGARQVADLLRAGVVRIEVDDDALNKELVA